MDINSISVDFIPENYGGNFLSGAQLTGSYVSVPVINPYILSTWSQMTENEDDLAANRGGPSGGRELVAQGVTTEINIIGGGGIAIEAGYVSYKGKEYGIYTFSVGGGFDINSLPIIIGKPNTQGHTENEVYPYRISYRFYVEDETLVGLAFYFTTFELFKTFYNY